MILTSRLIKPHACPHQRTQPARGYTAHVDRLYYGAYDGLKYRMSHNQHSQHDEHALKGKEPINQK